MTYDLGTRREEWKRWIKRELERNGSNQMAVAANIQALPEGDGKGKATTVNTFIGGDPDSVGRWFEEHPEWVSVLEDEMGCENGEVRRRFDTLRGGQPSATSWHDAFPEVTLSEAEIPAPLASPLGSRPDAVAAAWVSEVHARKGAPPEPLAVIGPVGRSRDLAVEQLRSAVAGRVTDQVHISAGEDIAPGTWTLVVGERPPARLTRIVQLVPWGARDVAALAERLSRVEGLPSAHRQALRGLAALLSTEPDTGALALSPDLAIRLAAEVARGGCPVDIAGLRARVTTGAWRRAAPSEGRLNGLNEGLLERYFAGLARRKRGADETGPWYVVAAGVAEATLRAAAIAEQGEAAGRSLLPLVDTVAAAKGDKARLAAIAALRAEVLCDPIPTVLEELITGRILVPQRRSGQNCIRPVEPHLAAMWAARGLAGEVALAAPWSTLCDPEWGRLIEEQARLGMPVAAFQRALERAPAPLCIDAAVALLRFATAAPTVSAPPDIVAAWATVMWAVAHGFLGAHMWGAPWEWANGARPALAAFTHRYRHHLPRMGDDPIAQVHALVPDEARRMVANWRSTPEVERADAPVISEQWGLLLFEGLPDRRSLIRAMISAAPDVFVLNSPTRGRQWTRWPARCEERVIEEAERGDVGCVAMLSGAMIAATPEGADQDEAYRFWRDLPWEVRLTWAARAGPTGQMAAKLLRELVKSDNAEDPRLLQAAERVGAGAMEWHCRYVLLDHAPHGSALPAPFALAVAERLRMTNLLEEIAAAPFALAPTLIPRLQDGPLMVGDRMERPETSHPWSPRIPVERRLDMAEAHAARAAEALHRLGRPDALRARWQQQGPRLPLEGIVAKRRIEGLLHLACSPLHEWTRMGVPWEVLAGFGDEDRPESADWLGRFLVPDARAWDVLQEVGAEHLPPLLVRALAGLAAMLYRLPAPFPAALDEVFDRDPAHPLPTELEYELGRHADEGRRAAAAHALLTLGDDAPIESWARREWTEEGGPPHARAAAHVVEGRLAKDPDVLERCWAAFSARGETGDAAQSRRWTLLGLGSTPQSEPTHRVFPLPFVVAAALASPNPEEIERLPDRNGARAQWLPVIRKNLAEAPDARTRAHWTLLRARHETAGPTALAALHSWLHDDPAPWSGGERWHREGSAYRGGTRELLEAALHHVDDWTTAGLARLFALALALPGGGGYESYDEAPERVALNTRDTGAGWLMNLPAPWPIHDLAAALVERGRTEVVLDAWRTPIPAGITPPEGTACPSRAEEIQEWLMPWWLKHAPSSELRAQLWGAEHFNLRAAWELVERGEADLADDAMRAIETILHPHWRLLGEVAPERLELAFRGRLHGDIPWRLAAADFSSAVDELGAYAAAVAVREVIANASPDVNLRSQSDRESLR